MSRRVAKDLDTRNKLYMKAQYDKDIKPISFEVGDCVYLFCPNLSQKSNCRKLCRRWVGPYVIVEVVRGVTVRLKNLSTNRLLPTLVHVNRLKRAYDRTERPPDNEVPAGVHAAQCEGLGEDCFGPDDFEKALAKPTSGVVDKSEVIESSPETKAKVTAGDELYVVEKILKARKNKLSKKPECLIKWDGYSNKFNTWEPLENLNEVAHIYYEKWVERNRGKKKH